MGRNSAAYYADTLGVHVGHHDAAALELLDGKLLSPSCARDSSLRNGTVSEHYYCDHIPEKSDLVFPDVDGEKFVSDDGDWKGREKMANSGLYDSDFEDDVRSMYNANDVDSDSGSLLDVDSPADGYFEPRSHPQETFVQNPTTAEQAAKAIEAAQEHSPAPDAPAGRAPSSSPPTSRSPVWAADGQAPLLDAGPAPPDYAAATAGRRALPPTRDGLPVENNQEAATNYGTVPPLPQPARSPPPQQQFPRPHHYPHPYQHPQAPQHPHAQQTDDNEQQGQQDFQWPFGNRGNPFAAPNWPWGPQGGPFGIPGVFNRDHPLVRQGLFGSQGPQGFWGADRGEQIMQSMRDGAPPPPMHPPTADSGLRGGGGEHEGEEQADEETSLLSRRNRSWSRRERSESRSRRRDIGRGRRSWWKKMARRCCKPMCLVNVALVAGILILIVLLSQASGSGGENGDGSPPTKNPDAPVTNPPDQGDDNDGDGMPNTGAPTLAHPRTAQCPYSVFSEPLRVDFANPANFSFLEMIETRDNAAFGTGRIGGTLQILPAPTDQDVDVRVWVSVAMTPGWQVKGVVYVQHDGDKEGVEVLFPRVEKVGSTGSGRPCMDFAVAILVRKGVELGNWETSTANLNVIVESGLFDARAASGRSPRSEEDGLQITNATSIFATHGCIKTAYWNSRETRVETLSGSIRGTYALRDVLALKSQSGSIHVNVDPKEADEDAPRPAELIVESRSGSVRTDIPADADNIPNRDYKTRVETRSSSIRGTYLMGSSAVFTSESGSKDIDIIPCLCSDTDGVATPSATLRTEARSGSTKVTLLSPSKPSSSSSWYGSGKEPLIDHLSSTHHSASGSLSLVYPDEWTGTIDGESSSGSIKIAGKDVKIVADVDTGPIAKIRHVVARKGLGESKLGFRTGSGSVRVLVGEV